MIVSMWMTREVVTISPDALVAEAARVMARRSVRRLPVVRHRAPCPRLLGIISAHDVLHAFPPEINPFCVANEQIDRTTATVSQIMSYPVLTVEPDTPIEEAARLCRDRRIGAIPVVKDSRLVGIITESDIFRVFTSVFAKSESGLRITYDLSHNGEEFRFLFDAADRHGLRVASILTCECEGRLQAVVQVVGTDDGGFLDEVWNSGHRVLNVLR